VRFDALLENCVFYILRMYEFSHRVGQQPNADRVSPGHQPISVVLDLVYPIGTRGRAVGGGRKAGLYKAGRMGTHQHTGVIDLGVRVRLWRVRNTFQKLTMP
jgi:hypothetical protein